MINICNTRLLALCMAFSIALLGEAAVLTHGFPTLEEQSHLRSVTSALTAQLPTELPGSAFVTTP